MFSVVIPMAGVGKRSGLNMNKALCLMNDSPLFMYSLNVFKKYECEIILVCNPLEEDVVRGYAKDGIKIAYGGSTRAESVKNGILMASNDIILVHDAARPFISKDIIDGIIEAMKDSKCAYAGIKCKDTVRDIGKGIIDRENLILAQTPQAGYKNDFLYAFKKAEEDNITLTDDISYLEKYFGYHPTLVKGSEMNFKVTTPSDVKIAKAILGR